MMRFIKGQDEKKIQVRLVPRQRQTDAVRLLLTRVAHGGALPFEPLVPNAETIAAMKKARAGKLTSFNSIEDLMADLNADD